MVTIELHSGRVTWSWWWWWWWRWWWRLRQQRRICVAHFVAVSVRIAPPPPPQPTNQPTNQPRTNLQSNRGIFKSNSSLLIALVAMFALASNTESHCGLIRSQFWYWRALGKQIKIKSPLPMLAKWITICPTMSSGSGWLPFEVNYPERCWEWGLVCQGYSLL